MYEGRSHGLHSNPASPQATRRQTPCHALPSGLNIRALRLAKVSLKMQGG